MRPQAHSLKGGRTIASLSEESAALENAEPCFFFFVFSQICRAPIPLSLIPLLFSLFSDN